MWQDNQTIRRPGLADTHPLEHTPPATLAVGGYYRYGFGGDHNPGARYPGDSGNCLTDLTVVNLTAGVNVRVGASIFGMAFPALSRYVTLRPGWSWRPEGILGAFEVYNPHGGAGVATWQADASMTLQSNNPRSGHPGHDPELGFRMVGVSGQAVMLAMAVPWNMTVTYVGLWAVAAPVDTGNYTLTVTGGAGAGVALLAAAFDLETLVAGTVSAPGLSAVPGVLDLDLGQQVRVTATSTGVLTNGAFLVLVMGVAR